MVPSIILYDIPSTTPGYSVSPNTWRTRYALNLKLLPFTTQWVEFPDIAALYASLDLPPKANPGDQGPARYTLPMIYDASTGRYIADSLAIAEYLDKQYPANPSSSSPPADLNSPNSTSTTPANTFPLDAASQASMRTFTAAAMPLMQHTCIRQLLTWSVLNGLTPRSAAYYQRTREVVLQKRAADLQVVRAADDGKDDGDGSSEGRARVSAVSESGVAVSELETLKEMLGAIAALYTTSGGVTGQTPESPYLLGSGVPCWADILLASVLVVFGVSWGENSKPWKELISWHDGQWGRLMEDMRKYE